MSYSKMSNSTGLSLSSNFSESEKATSHTKSKMDYLLLALWIMNPNDIDPPPGIIIPNTPKRRLYPLSTKNGMKKVMKLDHTYCTPLPAAVLCPECNNNSRYKTLLQCDYCPQAYHQGCLNTPMTTMPNGSRWMCPNHPQYLIDCVASLPALTALELSARAWPVYTVMVRENLGMGSIVMNVGTAEGCALRLNSALCHRVSSNHAVIYMNQETREFKLTNYSEHGSAVVVNGVVYSLGEAQARGPAAEGEARAARPQLLDHPCCCWPHHPDLSYGASALLSHGCLLEFGCQIFLFSITPVTPKPVSCT